MKCYVYIIQSNKNQQFYIGSSKKPITRLNEHNKGKVAATKNKGPWEIKIMQKYNSPKKARNIEYRLKKLKRKDIIKRIIDDGYIKMN